MHKHFTLITQPARYVGGETGAIIKHGASLRWALAFPEIYELAMSHLGIKVIYDMMAHRSDVACERVFAPWVDLMDRLYASGDSLCSLEGGSPLSQFDVIGFSLPYELLYTNMLHMLKLSDIPLRREERTTSHPVIIGGGPCMVNPEPVADFLDLALVGEAELVLNPLLDLLIKAKREKWTRPELYSQAAELPGIYAPALFEPVYEDGRFMGMTQKGKVKRAIVPNLKQVPMPTTHIVPSISPVHDRLGLEITRGCTRGCRFCQAGYIYRPARERDPGQIFDAALAGIAKSGMEEIALLSLSTGDYTCIEELSEKLMDSLASAKVSLSLPSLRVDSLSPLLAEQIKRVRKTGFTLAPEAGSSRMRAIINKNITEEQIIDTAAKVYALGWEHIKLYFMVGLPGESDEDLQAMGRLCAQVAESARQAGKGRGNKALVHASMGLFVPKPHTPFQWEGQLGLEEARERMRRAKAGSTHKRVKVKWNDALTSQMEGVLSRGDRRLSRVLEIAVEQGARFDGWSEHFNLELWLRAMEQAGLSLHEYLRARRVEEALPWDHIDVGVSKDFLLRERQQAFSHISTADCRHGACQGCGVCDWQGIKPIMAQSNWSPLRARPALDEGGRVNYRFVLQKTGPARFLGHLEMISQLVRCFRRAGVEVAYSQGFHPHPLLKTASALPLGVESEGEDLEVALTRRYQVDQLIEMLNQAMPQGLHIAGARLSRPGEPLQDPPTAIYFISQTGELDAEAVERFRLAASWPWLRQGPKGEKGLELKGSVLDLQLMANGVKVIISLSGARPRPAEILQAVFGLDADRAATARVVKQYPGNCL